MPIGSVGIDRRVNYVGEQAVVWGGSVGGEWSLVGGNGTQPLAFLVDDKGNSAATVWVDMQGGTTAVVTMPSNPGIYTLMVNNKNCGQVTVVPRPENPGTIYDVSKVSDFELALASLKDNDTIELHNSLSLNKPYPIYATNVTLQGGELINNLPASSQETLLNANGHALIIRNMLLRDYNGHGRHFMTSFLNLDNVEMISMQLNNNGGPISNLRARHCKFRSGAGIAAGSNSSLKNCTWDSRPCYSHPVMLYGDEIALLYNNFFSTERAWLSHGSQHAVCCNQFENISGTPNQQEQGMIEDGGVSDGLLLAHNIYRGGVGPAFQAWNNGGNAPFTVRNIFSTRNRIFGSNTAFNLYAPNKDGTIDNFYSLSDFFEFCGTLITTTGNVTNATVDSPTFGFQMPHMDTNWNFSPEACNPLPLVLTALQWNPSRGTISFTGNAPGPFKQCHVGCRLRITGGTGWGIDGVNGNWQQIMGCVSPTEINVRNYMGANVLTGGTAKVDGMIIAAPPVVLKNGTFYGMKSAIHGINCNLAW